MLSGDNHNSHNNKLKIISVRDNFNFVKEWFRLAHEGHFWVSWRLAVLKHMLNYINAPTHKNLKGVDIGCGNSVVRKQIESITAWNIDGYDLDKDALSIMPDTRGNLFLYDIRDQKIEFKEHYDVLVMFDILEHYHNAVAFLEAAAFHLKPDGMCIINVPAIELLRSRYDEVAGHELRYSKKILKKNLESAGFNIVDMRYWGFFLILPLWIRRFVVSFCEEEGEVIRKGFLPPTECAHKLLRLIGRMESFLMRRPPMGTSIMVIAVKKNEK